MNRKTLKKDGADSPDVRHEITRRIDDFWTKNKMTKDGFWSLIEEVKGSRQYYEIQKERRQEGAKVASAPSLDVLIDIARKYRDLNIDWLIRGGPEDEMLKSNLSSMYATRPEKDRTPELAEAMADAKLIERCLTDLKRRLVSLGAEDSLTKLKPNESKEGELPKIVEDQRTPDLGANNRK